MSLTPAAAVPCPRETMTTSSVDYIIQHYVFPCQLTVFTFVAYKTIQKIANEQTRVVARHSFFLLIAIDFLILATMLPQSLFSFEFFYSSESLRRLFHYSKIVINSSANYFSAVEIFLTLTICAECYVKARQLTRIEKIFKGQLYGLLLLGIFGISLMITFYHFFIYELKTGYQCDGTKLLSRVAASEDYFSMSSVKIFNTNQAICSIIVPGVLVLVLVRKIVQFIKEGKMPLKEVEDSECQQFFSSTDCEVAYKRELLVYFPLIAISFVLSHSVSFIPFLIDLFPSLRGPAFVDIISITNNMLLWGKLVTLYAIFKSCHLLGASGLVAEF
ncbi:hypothetical protein WR25_02302 [Diploscapter pachys]|uniref:G-protein coupled receptors family 1 profile domain-containing protein n=1 Tax=Diploscapter pachys TaxID=2018661 RepID=A0A2A2J7S9_9BILA|nr:hypothetical protein WR25_02302 [Diploscapter pachys]